MCVCICFVDWLCLGMTFLYISYLTQVFIFFGEMFLSMNWAIVADILLVSFLLCLLIFLINWSEALKIYHGSFSVPPKYVVVPTRRSTAEAFQIVLSHLLGDAGSPYLIGVVCVTVLPEQWNNQFNLLFCSINNSLISFPCVRCPTHWNRQTLTCGSSAPYRSPSCSVLLLPSWAEVFSSLQPFLLKKTDTLQRTMFPQVSGLLARNTKMICATFVICIYPAAITCKSCTNDDITACPKSKTASVLRGEVIALSLSLACQSKQH